MSVNWGGASALQIPPERDNVKGSLRCLVLYVLLPGLLTTIAALLCAAWKLLGGGS